MCIRKVFFLLIMLVVLFPALALAQPRPHKKLIEYGWDVPTPDFIQSHIRQMEQRPFNGLIFRLNKFDHGFDTHPWDAKSLQPQLDTLRAIQWQRFTDNFVMLFAANDAGMDWFNDAQWQTIEANLRLFATGLTAGRCAGVCFDPEPYGKDPWVFKGRFGDKTLVQVWDQVRRRGRQFISALQSGAPELKILSFYHLALYSQRLNEIDEKKRMEAIGGDSYALWAPFFLGMLEGAAPGVTFIDGNEYAYYYNTPDQYYRAYHLMRQRVMALVPVELRKKFNAQCQAGMAVYLDQLLGLRADTKTLGNFMSPTEQLRFLEHNTYYALDSADEYVWVYGERIDWWGSKKDSAGQPSTPDGMETAISMARKKYQSGQPLGYDITAMIAAARKKMNEKK